MDQFSESNRSLHRLLVINDFRRIGGAERVVLDVIKHLQSPTSNLEWEISVVTSGPGSFADACRDLPVTNIFFEDIEELKQAWKNPLAWRRVRRNLACIAADTRPDLILANAIWPAIVVRSVAQAAAIPLMCALHAAINPKRLDKRLIAQGFSPIILRGINHWVTVSQGLADQLKRLRVKKNSISIIPNGVNIPDRIAPVGNIVASSWRHRLGISDQAIVLACIGRLHPGKGQHHVLQAFSCLPECSEECHLIITGDEMIMPGSGESFMEQLQRLAFDLRPGLHVHFTGFVRDANEILLESDILVSGSLEESFGLAVLEGMAVGCAVVATAVGGHLQTVVDGESGILVPVADIPAMRRALQDVVCNSGLRRKLGVAARKAAAAYEISLMLCRWEETLAGAIKSA